MESLIVILLSVVVFVVCAFGIHNRTMLAAFPDETATFAIAAYFSGHDWSQVMYEVGYYSFGFPVLLVPFVVIFNRPYVVYILSLLLNAGIAATIVPLSYMLCKRWGLAGVKSNRLIVFVVLFISLSGAAIAYTQLGLPEVALIATAFAVTLGLYKIQEEKSKHYWFVLQAFLLVYGFAFHQRFLAVMIAGAFVVLLMAILKRIDYKKAITFFIAFFAFIAIHEIIKNHLQANLWAVAEWAIADTPAAPLQNDFERVVTHATHIVTQPDRVLPTLRIAVGQMFYLGVASIMLIYFAIHQLIKKNIKFVFNIREQKKDFDFVLMFMIIAFFLTFAISVLFLHASTRGDVLIYGRYNSIMYLVLSLYILIQIIKGNYRISIAPILIAVAFLAMTIWTDYNFRHYFTNTGFIHTNAVNFIFFRESALTAGNPFFAAFMVSGLLGMLIPAFQKIKKVEVMRVSVSVILVAGIFLSYSSATKTTAYYAHSASAGASASVTVSKIEDTDLPVYFLRNHATRRAGIQEQIMQYALFNRTLNLVNHPSQITPPDYYLILNSPLIFLSESEFFNATLIYGDQHFILFRISTSEESYIQADGDTGKINISHENALRIGSQNAFEMLNEELFVWTAPITSLLLDLDAGEDYLFRVNLPFQIPSEVGTLNVQFIFFSDEENIIVHETTIDSSTTNIEFIVPREKLPDIHPILHIIGDTWTPVGVFGPDAIDTRSLGFPIASVETIPMSEIEN